MTKWNDCTYAVKLKVMHKLSHEYGIPEADLTDLMTMLGFDTNDLRVYNHGGRPGEIFLSMGRVLTPMQRMNALQRIVDSLRRQILADIICTMNQKDRA